MSASLLRLFLLELCSTFGMYVGSEVNVVCAIFGSYGEWKALMFLKWDIIVVYS